MLPVSLWVCLLGEAFVASWECLIVVNNNQLLGGVSITAETGNNFASIYVHISLLEKTIRCQLIWVTHPQNINQSNGGSG